MKHFLFLREIQVHLSEIDSDGNSARTKIMDHVESLHLSLSFWFQTGENSQGTS